MGSCSFCDKIGAYIVPIAFVVAIALLLISFTSVAKDIAGDIA